MHPTTVLDPVLTTPPAQSHRHQARLGDACTHRALALAAGPLLLWLSGALHPHDSVSGLVTYHSAAAHHDLWLAVHVLGVLAALVWAWGALALMLPTGKGARTLRIGARLLIVGLVAQAFDQWGHGVMTYVATTIPNAPLFTPSLIWRYEHATPVVILMALTVPMILGMLLAAIGLYRSRLVPRWVAVVLALSILPPTAVNNSGAALLIAAVPMIAAFAYTARRSTGWHSI